MCGINIDVYKRMDERWYKMEKEHHKREIWRLVETDGVEHDGVAKMENYPILTVMCVSSIITMGHCPR